MTTIKEQELNLTASILQNKTYIDNLRVQEQLFKGLLNYDIFSQMINDQELNRYLYPYLLNLVQQAQVNTYNEGKILNLQGQNYNTLYLILSGKVLFYKQKNTSEIDNEMYFIKQEESHFKQVNNQMEEKIRKINEDLFNKKNKKNNFSQQNNSNNAKQMQVNQQKYYQQMREYQRKQKPYGDIYSLINGKQDAPRSAAGTLKTLQNPEDNMLRNSTQCSSQYYQGPICLYKIHSTKQMGDYFGEIVNNVKGRKADFTAVVGKHAIILQISGIQFYQIFKNIIYQLNFVYQILDLSFKGYSRKVLLEIALNSERRDYRQDQMIYAQGSPSTGFYILKEGEVAIVHNKKKIKFIKKGSIFGKCDMFYKKRKFEVQSDSNKTVVFEIQKQSINNYYFLKDIKEKGEQELKQYQQIVNNEGNIHQAQQNQSQIYNSKLNNLTMVNNNSLSLNKTQMNILNNFISSRGQMRSSVMDKSHRPSSSATNFFSQQNNNNNDQNQNQNQKFYGSDNNNLTNNRSSINGMFSSSGNMRSSFTGRQNTHMMKSVSNNYFSNKRDQVQQQQQDNPSVDMSRNRSGGGSAQKESKINVERIAMLRDQDVFNVEDYQENHFDEIKQMKKVNKIILDGNRKIFVTHSLPKSQQSRVKQPSKHHIVPINEQNNTTKGVQFNVERPQTAQTNLKQKRKLKKSNDNSPEEMLQEQQLQQQQQQQKQQKTKSISQDEVIQSYNRQQKMIKIQQDMQSSYTHKLKYALNEQYTKRLNVNLDYNFQDKSRSKYTISQQNSPTQQQQQQQQQNNNKNQVRLSQIALSPINSQGQLQFQQQPPQQFSSAQSPKSSLFEEDYSAFSKNQILKAKQKQLQEQQLRQQKQRQSQLLEQHS